MTTPLAALRTWPPARWLVALGATVGFTLAVAVPTAMIDNPVFGREIPTTSWAWPSLLVSSALAGLLVATYVRSPGQPDRASSRRAGWVGGVLTYLAVGCPVCNKLVLLALGSAGAVTWFAPFQPVLQGAAVLLLLWALRSRLLGELSCSTTPSGEPARA